MYKYIWFLIKLNAKPFSTLWLKYLEISVEEKYYPSRSTHHKFLFIKRDFCLLLSQHTWQKNWLHSYLLLHAIFSLGLLTHSPFWSSHPGKPSSKSFNLFKHFLSRFLITLQENAENCYVLSYWKHFSVPKEHLYEMKILVSKTEKHWNAKSVILEGFAILTTFSCFMSKETSNESSCT